MRLKILASLFIATTLSGCAAVGVPLTLNPASKLKSAEYLFDREDRPLPAERLIMEAIETYKARGDNAGLADAYRIYAHFLISRAVTNWGKGYQNRGFIDKDVTFENRYRKALEYCKKAIALYEKESIYSWASNVYLLIGKMQVTYFNNNQMACENYTKAIESHMLDRKKYPNQTYFQQPGFESFEEYVNALKDDLGCPNGKLGEKIGVGGSWAAYATGAFTGLAGLGTIIGGGG